MSDNRENRRDEERERAEGTARVRVLEAPFAELKDTTLDASIYDVSASGLRIECDELLDQCTLLLRVTLAGSSEDIPLRGDVLWASFEEDGSYQMGVEFKGNDSPVIIKWHALLKSL